jgi:hypothetical protein
MINSLPDPENRFPNCVRMELEISPIQPQGIFNKIFNKLCLKEPEQIDLILNIHFDEQQEEIHYRSGNVGNITFGLKRGELKIELIDGEVLLKNIKLKNDFQTVVETEVQEEKGGEGQIGAQGALKSAGINVGTKTAKKKSVKVKTLESQVRTGGGTPDKPSWIFEVKTSKDILQGLLQKTELAIIDVKSKPCRLVATFVVRKTEDICITNGELLWSKNITKKKIAVIQRTIARLLLNEILNQKPYLSRVELVHE